MSMEVTDLIVTAVSQEGETEGGTEQDRKWEHLTRKHLSELSFHCEKTYAFCIMELLNVYILGDFE